MKNITPINTKNKYEILFIIKSGTTEADREAAIKKYIALIEQAGGTIDLVDKWGNRRFAYDIDFKHDGYYVLIYFTSAPTLPKELERVMLISEEVVRFMVINRNNLGEPVEQRKKNAVVATEETTNAEAVSTEAPTAVEVPPSAEVVTE